MDTLTLNQYQKLFSQAAYREDHEAPHNRLVQAITPGGTLSSLDALEVYQRGTIVRLTEALGETYEAVWWVAGDEDFFRLAKMFILSHPSHTYNLSSYGQEFSEFLRQERPFPSLPFLPELAQFEWMFKNIFHITQHDAISQETIQRIAEQGNVRFEFGPSVHLFTSPFAVYDIWKLRGACHDGRPPVNWEHEQHLLLYKKQDQIFVNELNTLEYAVLELLLNGTTLEESLDQVASQFPELQQEQISKLFQVIFHTGIIQNISADLGEHGEM